MKNWILFGICFLGFVISALAAGCGQSSDSTTTTTTLGSVTISGSLYSGTVRTSAVNASASGVRSMGSAASAIANYNVVAVGTTDNKIYFPDAKTDASGNFSISNLPSGESFYLEIINDQKKFVAPLSFGATTDATGTTNVVMAITSEAGGGALNLGQIVYESGRGAAVPTLEVSAGRMDKDSTARRKSGESFVPVGTGLNLGRGTGEAKFTGTLRDRIDEDDDGIPDIFDVDDNGDGKVDGLDSTPRLTGRVEVKLTSADHANAFTNLPEQYEVYPTYISGSLNTTPIDVSTASNLAIEVVMNTGVSPSTFSDVRIVEGPAWIDTAKISSDGPAGDIGKLWKDNNYKLYSSTDRWTVHVTPYGTPEAGDILKFQLTDTAGTKQYFIFTISYVFKDVPRLVKYSYTGGSVTTRESTDLNLSVYQAGSGGTSNAFTYEGSTLTLFWTDPKDDLGSYLTGMTSYLDGINYYKADGSILSAGSLLVTPDAVSDATFGTLNRYTFTPTTESFTYFKVDIKSQSPLSGGGNASQMVNFKKI